MGFRHPLREFYFQGAKKCFGGRANEHNKTENVFSDSTDLPSLGLIRPAHHPLPIIPNPCAFEGKYKPRGHDLFARYVTKCWAVAV